MLLTPRRALWAPIALLGGGLCGCAEPLGPDECNALLDQYVRLLAQSDRPGTTDAEILKLKAQAREKAARDPAFARCSRAVSRRQFECALKANSADHFEQCLL